MDGLSLDDESVLTSELHASIKRLLKRIMLGQLGVLAYVKLDRERGACMFGLTRGVEINTFI